MDKNQISSLWSIFIDILFSDPISNWIEKQKYYLQMAGSAQVTSKIENSLRKIVASFDLTDVSCCTYVYVSVECNHIISTKQINFF